MKVFFLIVRTASIVVYICVYREKIYVQSEIAIGFKRKRKIISVYG